MNDRSAVIRTVADIDREEISWLWPGRIPLRKYSTIAGDPGLGKSLLTMMLAAKVSTGSPFPDNERPPLGDVFLMSAEDDAADTIRPRLEAHFADLSRIHILDAKREDGRIRIATLADISVFQDALAQVRENGGDPKLLVIDPLEAYLAGRDGNGNAEIRELLTPLALFARKENIAVVGIQHLNKSPRPAAYRVGGSIGFTAAARAVWIVTRDKEDDDTRLFVPLKMNLAAEAPGLTFTIEPDVENVPTIVWHGATSTTAREALEEEPRERPSPTQDRVLEIIVARGEARTGEIAETLQKSEQSVSNALGKLASKGKIAQAGVPGLWKTA